MNEKNKVFKKLLPAKELFRLYQNLSDIIVTKIDVKNLGFDFVAVNNSIDLLCEVGMVHFDQQKNVFKKAATKIVNYNDFAENLYLKLLSSYTDAFLFIDQSDLKYDEAEAKLYIKRNSVSLDLSGLIMLLDGIQKIKIRHNDIYILDKTILNHRLDCNRYPFHDQTLAELKNLLERKEQYGIDAELAAMEYETELLKNTGINEVPERISEYNTSAGYDIVSFMCNDSRVPDKFIEVKSCSDDNWLFYISNNEIEVAQRKQDNYFLYLFNRKSHKFRIIQNPYNFIIGSEKNDWAIEPQVYKVKSLENFSISNHKLGDIE